MAHDPINVGYARALFEMAQAEAIVARVEEELFRLRDLLKMNPALLEFLKDPNVHRESKRQALIELFQGRVHPLALNALFIISDQDRAGRLQHIIGEFTALADAARNTITGEVITAHGLDDAMLDRLSVALSRRIGKNVLLLRKVDPAILGGAIVKIGDRVVDGSLRGKLNRIKEQLTQ